MSSAVASGLLDRWPGTGRESGLGRFLDESKGTEGGWSPEPATCLVEIRLAAVCNERSSGGSFLDGKSVLELVEDEGLLTPTVKQPGDIAASLFLSVKSITRTNCSL